MAVGCMMVVPICCHSFPVSGLYVFSAFPCKPYLPALHGEGKPLTSCAALAEPRPRSKRPCPTTRQCTILRAARFDTGASTRRAMVGPSLALVRLVSDLPVLRLSRSAHVSLPTPSIKKHRTNSGEVPGWSPGFSRLKPGLLTPRLFVPLCPQSTNGIRAVTKTLSINRVLPNFAATASRTLPWMVL